MQPLRMREVSCAAPVAGRCIQGWTRVKRQGLVHTASPAVSGTLTRPRPGHRLTFVHGGPAYWQILTCMMPRAQHSTRCQTANDATRTILWFRNLVCSWYDLTGAMSAGAQQHLPMLLVGKIVEQAPSSAIYRKQSNINDWHPAIAFSALVMCTGYDLKCVTGSRHLHLSAEVLRFQQSWHVIAGITLSCMPDQMSVQSCGGLS